MLKHVKLVELPVADQNRAIGSTPRAWDFESFRTIPVRTIGAGSSWNSRVRSPSRLIRAGLPRHAEGAVEKCRLDLGNGADQMTDHPDRSNARNDQDHLLQRGAQLVPADQAGNEIGY